MSKALVFILLILPNLVTGQDSLNKPKGKWVIFGKERTASRESHIPHFHGFEVHYWSDSTKESEGEYVYNKKDGIWLYYYRDGITLKLKETWANGDLDGPYESYYPDGSLKLTGYYEMNRTRTLHTRYYQSGCIEYKAFYDEYGRENGVVTYYFDCDIESELKVGQIEFTYTSVSGIPTGSATRYNQDGSIKEQMEYKNDGSKINIVD